MADAAVFIAGTVVLMAAGGLHAVQALRDSSRPRVFAPIDRAVQPAMEGTGLRLRHIFPGDESRPSMWSAWLGFNVSHGLGVFAFGLVCLVIAVEDFALVEQIDALRPITIAFSLAYFGLSLRFWFYVPALITGTATLCFTTAALLSA